MQNGHQIREYKEIKKSMKILVFNGQKNTSCMELTGGLKNFITDTFPYSPTSLMGRRPSGVTR